METVRADIEQTMRAIESAKDKMVALFRDVKVLRCESYELPLVTKDNETERPDSICINTNTDIENSHTLLREINRWYARADTYENHLSTKASQRIPGFIHVQMGDHLYNEFEMVTQHLNRLKDTFKQHVTSIKKPDARFALLHEMYPMLITTNLYRKVKLYRNSTYIKFFWANKPRIEKVDYEQLQLRLENSKIHSSAAKVDAQAWHDKIDEELELLKTVDDKSSLRFVRPTKAQPMVKVDGKPTSCPTPVIVATNDCEPLSVEGLSNYNKASQRKGTGREAREYNELVPRLSLFQAIPL